MTCTYAHFTEAVGNARAIMTDYFCDLQTDASIVSRFPPETPWLQAVRPTGTYLIIMPGSQDETWPAPGDKVPYLFGFADRDHILKGKVHVAEYVAKDCPHHLFQYWNGRKLASITGEQVVLVLRQYQANILLAWRRGATPTPHQRSAKHGYPFYP
jgi:hypothetical protein